jgi:spermidine/putrescine transport system ATP-binding protein
LERTVLELRDITKSFGATDVLRGISLSVKEGEFITLLGSSGCGKTTTLRIIAGLERPDSGKVFLSGADVSSLPPDKRNVNMVFQNYALFPHMNAETNIGYGLRLKKTPKSEIKREAEQALELVGLAGFQKRFPSELSGGQCQRVAIARAIVNKPKVLLLDEPLGALDLQLRRRMQLELKKLQKQIGIAFIYITHDQEEALNMSDRIALMRDGRFEQLGAVGEVYDRPRTAYAAQFIGGANIFEGKPLFYSEGTLVAQFPGGLAAISCAGGQTRTSGKICAAVRGEYIELQKTDDESGFGIKAIVKEKSFAGGLLRIAARLEDGKEIIASRHGIDSPLNPGDRVRLNWKPENAVLLECEDVKA